MKFGEYFRNLRNSRAVTQQQIADVIGKNPMLISNVENNKNGPFTEEDLGKISNYLNLSKKDRKELFVEAAKENAKLPQYIWEYFIRHEEIFTLVEIITEKKLNNEQLLKIIDYIIKMTE